MQLQWFAVDEKQDFKRSRTNTELRCGQKVWMSESCMSYKVAVSSGFFSKQKAKFPTVPEKFSSYLNEKWKIGYAVSHEMCQLRH
jgi:hypothetical protein